MEFSEVFHIPSQKTYNKHQIWMSQSEIHKTTHHLHETSFMQGVICHSLVLSVDFLCYWSLQSLPTYTTLILMLIICLN